MLGHLKPLLLAGHREIRQANPAHLASLDKLVKSRCHVLDLLGVVVEVGVVEINVVGMEPGQGGVNCGRDVLRRQALELWMGSNFRGDDDVVTSPAFFHPRTNDSLRLAPVIAVGPMGIAVSGVDQRSPGTKESVEDGMGVVFISRPAEGIGPQNQWSDVQICARDTSHETS